MENVINNKTEQFAIKKEASETRYWVKLLYKTEFISEKQYNELHSDVEEIIKILVASIKTLKRKAEK